MRARFSFSACSFTATYPPRDEERERERDHGSILLPTRDETKGKLTSAQWFSLLSRNCFQSCFVSYRWKRRKEGGVTFSFFFFLFLRRMEEERKRSNRSQIRFFRNRVPLKLDHGGKNFNLAFHRRRKIRVRASSFLFDVLADKKHGRNNIPRVLLPSPPPPQL